MPDSAKSVRRAVSERSLRAAIIRFLAAYYGSPPKSIVIKNITLTKTEGSA